ncbi:WD-repeat protein [Nostoc linckia z18]|uniref:WD-repeat protein n=3 Tax=Nostoc linckia TaxID=92942 RepID=A0A9Q5ZD57_NOSLI|nr:WD-repeat protein [Nostoc linckia z1]PHJ68518.1 WD-repeat protein [Nostoc linckia z3]PHJ74287.1 WD-repeat protein [Nostoc linckia z2]PHJ80350.1 WD-repeat protein [Nostoc linckia z4]PHJ87824.1 WD-repeat protein [Nostoc linckia z6]PHJ98103.1 WD-repeat protein [Nostoc linckia z7]PHK04420.1 WD-repeat protein [Nostoc linckia z8]PHK04958.1 WD-repeat protein [Nostoc linckia z9]PHK17358.1 WD-repeat protein [Nostoc linckia z14]PHK19524.1 WD-repeat protein [Nostoc linckia z13]PHK29797.1 WD-repea
MCRRTLRASQQGKILIGQARKKKGRIIEDPRWLEEAIEIFKKFYIRPNVRGAGISLMSWRRFLWAKDRIEANTFKTFCQVLGLNWEDIAENEVDAKRDLNEAPTIYNFFGRTQELAELQKWLIQERCRLIIVHGMGGIGKSALARHLVDNIADQYDYLIWISLQSAPPFAQTVIKLIQFLSQCEKEEGNISQIMQYLHHQRCLIVLDGWEEITEEDNEDTTSYKVFLERVAKEAHRSSLLLLSREKTQNITILEGQLVRFKRLGVLTCEEAKEILRAESLFGTDSELEEFSRRYSNPWILKRIAQSVRTVFDGDISPFMANSILVDDVITDFLDRQFEKLKKAEINLIYWVAIRRNSASWYQLVEDTNQFLSYNQLFQTLNDLLERHSLLVKNTEDIPTLFILDPVILKYTNNKFIESNFQEIVQLIESQKIEGTELFITHSLITEKPEDEELNQEQFRRIVRPIQKMLLTKWGSQQQLEDKLRNVLSLLEDRKLSQGYGYRNISYLISACNFAESRTPIQLRQETR